MSEGRSVLSPAKCLTGKERVNAEIKSTKYTQQRRLKVQNCL